MDQPKSLSSESALNERLALINEPHVKPLSRFVERLRNRMGSDANIPYIDPMDGGIHSEVLFLLEAPGPKARNSGFVSRNNPDETAKNFFQICQEAQIDRRRTVIWNVVPWYIGSDVKIRPAKSSDIAQGKTSLAELAALLPELKAIVLLGRKAQKVNADIKLHLPHCTLFECPHPSPMYVNRSVENRNNILGVFQEVYAFIGQNDRV